MLAETEEQREARRLEEYIRGRGGRITIRDLQRANNRRYPSAEAAEIALAALVDAGLARWEDPPTGARGPAGKALTLLPVYVSDA